MSNYMMQNLGVFPVDTGLKFRVWAAHADDVNLELFEDEASRTHKMTNEGQGFWSTIVSDAHDGQKYLYKLDGETKSDPRAQCMEHSAGKSVIDTKPYAWQCNDFIMPDWNSLVIYQMHCGTYPDKAQEKETLLLSIIDELWYLQKLGVNAIQLLPIQEFENDISMGYNPSAMFAIEAHYGGPNGLKQLVDAAHSKGIAVFLDVVYNHISPSGGPAMWQFTKWHQDFWVPEDGDGAGGGIYFYNDWRAFTPWGRRNRPDYGRSEVRDFLRDNAMMWLLDYRIDGLRFDSVVNIRNVYGNNNDSINDLGDGWWLLQQINGSIQNEQPWKITIAEDLQNNEWITKPIHEGGAGFGSQWDSATVHNMRDLLSTMHDGDRNMYRVREALYQHYNTDAFQRIVSIETHDEAAAANNNRRLTDIIGAGDVDNSWHAKKRTTLGAAFVLTAPGIPMLLQGNELLEYRQFGDNRAENQYVDWGRFCSKEEDCRECMAAMGICPIDGSGKCARGEDCSQCPDLPEHCHPVGQFKGIFNLYRDLIHLRRNWYNNTRGLRGQHINVFHVNNRDKLIAYHRWDQGGPGDDVVVVLNFADKAYSDYRLGFPSQGQWYVRFNSDYQGYDGSFGNAGSFDITTDNIEMDGLQYSGNIGIGPYTAVILSQ